MAELRKPSYWLSLFVTWVILVGVYLLFTSNLEKAEVYTALGAAAVAAAASAIFDSLGVVAFRPRLRDLAQAWRIPWYMVEGTWELGRAMGRQLFTRDGASSIVYAVPFEMGSPDNPADAARRALAIFYTTITPNFVVLGFVSEQRIMLYHQVLPGPVLQMTVNLGARP